MNSAGVSGVRVYDTGAPGPIVAIIGLTHGNEPVGGRLIDEMSDTFSAELVSGSLLCIKANEAAYEQGRRYTLGGMDMNRLWDRHTLFGLSERNPATLCYEERRVLELAPILMGCDVIVDIHSTTRPSPPFLLMRDDRRHRALVSHLGVKRVVTGLHEEGILGGGMSPDVGLVLGEVSKRLGFTFEAGQHDDPVSWLQAKDLVLRLLSALEMLKNPIEVTDDEPELYEVIDGFRQAPVGAERFRFVGYMGGEPGRGRRGDLRKLASFETVQAGEEVLRRTGGEVVRAPNRFTMLLPTPMAAPNTDLFYMALRRPSSLQRPVHPDSDEQARFLASGIEQTLDLLVDDEFNRGATWASFDNRQVLNIAADCIGRVCRLPSGHVHRKISIIGRGDWGGNLSEQRAGRRFSHALNRAIDQHVPIHRYQLMRGASLGWLEKIAEHDALFLSMAHANHVSVLVLGDVEWAIEHGDLRHVRVGLVVETATPEPDGDEVSIRLSRLGLFSARREILQAARSFMEQVQREHQWVLSTLSQEQRDLFEDPKTDTADVVGILCDLQTSSWSTELCDLVENTALVGPSSVTEWVLDLMSRSSVMDAASLKRWLVRPVQEGYLVRKEALQMTVDEWDSPWESVQPVVKIQGYPPVDSSEVNQDNFDRWLGWKRLLNSRQLIPDTRGQDTDLAFHVSTIQRILAEWYRMVRRESQQEGVRYRVVIAGDGFSPNRERRTLASALLRAHETLILDPRVSYVRIQNARGMNLRWAKGLCTRIAERGADSDCWIQLDSERKASVNAILIMKASEQESDTAPWSLEDWEMVCSGIVLEDYAERNDGYAVGMFTQSRGIDGANGNPDLLHFGREYCEGLLRKGGTRIEAEAPGELKREILVLMNQWARQIQLEQQGGTIMTSEQIARRLGLRDIDFTDWVMNQRGSCEEYWESLNAWPVKT